MTKENIAVLDIGSSKINLTIVSKGLNDSFKILGVGEADYSGYSEGTFFDISELRLAIGMAITNAQKSANIQIKKLYVGLPTEFTYCHSNYVELDLANRRKVTQEDLFQLYKKGNINLSNNDIVLIKCGLYDAKIDNDVCAVNELVGKKAQVISGNITYVYSDVSVINLFNSCFKEHAIDIVEYMSIAHAETKYLLDKQEGILIDCGYLSTTVSIAKDGNLKTFYSFSLGGAHIAGDICDYFNISFSNAETVKRNIILTLKPKMTDVYRSGNHSLSIKEVNEIAIARINQIAKTVVKCLKNNELDFRSMPIYLTGGGISYIRGVNEILSEAFEKNVETLAPSVPQLDKPHLSSSLGLINEVLSVQEKKKFSLVDFFKKKLYN